MNKDERESRKAIETHDGTVFDDVMRTMQERHPHLLLPLANEVFDENYDESDEVVRLPEEYQKILSRVIADSCSMICKNIYHFECQSEPDGNMASRMVEYGFMIARGNASKVGDVYCLNFPKSCVIYLRSKGRDDKLGLEITLMNGQVARYEIPVIRVCDYTLDELFQRKLYVYLPFYIMRYEGSFMEIEGDKKQTSKLVQEFRHILDMLKNELGSLDDGTYQDMVTLMRRVMNHELRNYDKLRERLGDVMGGKVLELPSDELRRAEERGNKRLNSLIAKLNEAGRLDDLIRSISDSNYQEQLFKEFGI